MSVYAYTSLSLSISLSLSLYIYIYIYVYHLSLSLYIYIYIYIYTYTSLSRAALGAVLDAEGVDEAAEDHRAVPIIIIITTIIIVRIYSGHITIITITITIIIGCMLLPSYLYYYILPLIVEARYGHGALRGAAQEDALHLEDFFFSDALSLVRKPRALRLRAAIIIRIQRCAAMFAPAPECIVCSLIHLQSMFCCYILHLDAFCTRTNLQSLFCSLCQCGCLFCTRINLRSLFRSLLRQCHNIISQPRFLLSHSAHSSRLATRRLPPGAWMKCGRRSMTKWSSPRRSW